MQTVNVGANVTMTKRSNLAFGIFAAVGTILAMGCGDNEDVCSGVLVSLDAETPLVDYWVWTLSEPEWQALRTSKSARNFVCIEEDYNIIRRCGGDYEEWRRVLSDGPPEMASCIAPEPAPKFGLTVQANQPASLSIGTTTTWQEALNWTMDVEVTAGVHDLVSISRYGDYLREVVDVSGPTSVTLEFSRATPLLPLSVLVSDAEADESISTEVVMTTARGTRLDVSNSRLFQGFRRVPQAHLEHGDIQQAEVVVSSADGGRIARSTLSLDDAPSETVVLPPRLKGHVELTLDPPAARWETGEAVFQSADDVTLWGETVDGSWALVYATRGWLESHDRTGIALDPASPISRLGPMRWIEVQAQFADPGPGSRSHLRLPLQTQAREVDRSDDSTRPIAPGHARPLRHRAI